MAHISFLARGRAGAFERPEAPFSELAKIDAAANGFRTIFVRNVSAETLLRNYLNFVQLGSSQLELIPGKRPECGDSHGSRGPECPGKRSTPSATIDRSPDLQASRSFVVATKSENSQSRSLVMAPQTAVRDCPASNLLGQLLVDALDI